MVKFSKFSEHIILIGKLKDYVYFDNLCSKSKKKKRDNKRLFPRRCLHVIRAQYISIPVVIAMRTNSSSSVKIIVCLLLISGKNKLTSKDYFVCNTFYSGD